MTNINDFRQLVTDTWEYQLIKNTRAVLKILKEEGSALKISEKEKGEIIIKMKWTAFASLPTREQLDLINKNLRLPLYDAGFDLERALSLKFYAVPATAWIDDFVPRAINAFLKNEELLGEKPLSLKPLPGVQQSTAKPTIGNWVSDYLKIVGMDKHEKIVVQQYMTTSPNAFSLNQEDKKALTKLLNLIEEVKVFSVEQIQREVEKIAAKEKQQNSATQAVETEAQRLPSIPKTPVAVSRTSPAPRTAPRQVDNIAVPVRRPAAEILRTPQPVIESNEDGHPAEVTPRQTSGPDENAYRRPEFADASEAFTGDLVAQKGIRVALQLHPKIADQLLTRNPITLIDQASTVNPTIQNWILDYRMRYGATGHTKEEQEQYMKRSPNTMRLDETERQRVYTIIKSYDDGSPVPVSEKSGQVVFD